MLLDYFSIAPSSWLEILLVESVEHITYYKACFRFVGSELLERRVGIKDAVDAMRNNSLL